MTKTELMETYTAEQLAEMVLTNQTKNRGIFKTRKDKQQLYNVFAKQIRGYGI